MNLSLLESENKIKCQAVDLGLITYQEAYKIQKGALEKRKQGKISDVLFLLEHRSVITIGRSGCEKNILISDNYLKANDIAICKTDRGGDATFHGPGQLIAYPVFDLKEQSKDVHLYLRKLEKTGIHFLKKYGIESSKKIGYTGVWVNSEKIASIGVGFSNWISYHGLAVNINTDLNKFSLINPCGISACKMTSLSEITGKTMDIAESKNRLIESFKVIFNLEIETFECVSPMA